MTRTDVGVRIGSMRAFPGRPRGLDGRPRITQERKSTPGTADGTHGRSHPVRRPEGDSGAGTQVNGASMAQSADRFARAGLAALVLAIPVLLLSPASALSSTASFKPTKVTRQAITFAPSGVEPAAVDHARVRFRHRDATYSDRALWAARVRDAIRTRHELRVRRPPNTPGGRLKVKVKQSHSSSEPPPPPPAENPPSSDREPSSGREPSSAIATTG